ncbi:MAG: hypothetical protein IPI06_07630 [Gammaproteobacteria bacterium]|nr:hypothetical protein [Gammaproteobacteria bacterium]
MAGEPAATPAALAIAGLMAVSLAAPGGHAGLLPSVNARTAPQRLPRPPGVPSDAELEAAGARIDRVLIEPGDVFDRANPQDDSTLSRLANRLHIMTRPSTIESQLLFSPGAPYSPQALAESERILRSTRYLYDAQIRPIAAHDGKVDIEVRTRDVWTLTPSIRFGRSGGRNTSGFELEELNLLGLGSELSVAAKSGIDRDSTSFIYRDRQLFGSWWGVSTQFDENSDGHDRMFDLDHPFYALDTRRAGGFSVEDDIRTDSQYDLGRTVRSFHTAARTASVYGGWSGGLQDGWVGRWRIGMSYDDERFDALPDATSPAPPDRRLVYPWISYERVQDGFVTARNRDQIERTEDFNLGWRFQASLGWAAPAFGADRGALILGAGLAKGLDASPRQTVLFEAGVRGRLEHGEVVNGRLNASTRYYFRRSERRLLFATAELEAGRRIDADQQILLGGDNGLRGYPLRYQAGEGRWLVTVEQRWFSNWYPFRLFNVGGAAFADVGRSWGRDPVASPSLGVLKDIGVGLRLGNARSASGNVLHIDLAFPLDGDPSISGMQVLVTTRHSF